MDYPQFTADDVAMFWAAVQHETLPEDAPALEELAAKLTEASRYYLRDNDDPEDDGGEMDNDDLDDLDNLDDDLETDE